MNKLKWLIFAIVVFTAAACEKGLIPVLITDIDSITLPPFTPEGTGATRVNAEDIRIKYQYNTSDDVTHIILGGEIANGIPEGLLWNEDAAGTFGVPVLAGTYQGRGDFKVGTLSDKTAATGGSAAIGSPNFDSEWVMGGFYTAIVVDGIVNNTRDVAVTETNESLRLFSKTYRENFNPEQAIFSEASGKMQKKNTYSYDPNRFRSYPDFPSEQEMKDGAKRGGYYILVSSKANPRAAFLEVEYANGSKKRIEIDYSGIGFREVPLTGLAFQNPSPASNSNYTYLMTGPELSDEGYYQYTAENVGVYVGSISIAKPLYLRPLYMTSFGSASIDPKKTTTNMISNVTPRKWDANEGTGNILQDPNLVVNWYDPFQAITVYYESMPEELPTPIVIRADLRDQNQFTVGTVAVHGLECIIEFYPSP
jgi:hypothetical protein